MPPYDDCCQTDGIPPGGKHDAMVVCDGIGRCDDDDCSHCGTETCAWGGWYGNDDCGTIEWICDAMELAGCVVRVGNDIGTADAVVGDITNIWFVSTNVDGRDCCTFANGFTMGLPCVLVIVGCCAIADCKIVVLDKHDWGIEIPVSELVTVRCTLDPAGGAR